MVAFGALPFLALLSPGLAIYGLLPAPEEGVPKFKMRNAENKGFWSKYCFPVFEGAAGLQVELRLFWQELAERMVIGRAVEEGAGAQQGHSVGQQAGGPAEGQTV